MVNGPVAAKDRGTTEENPPEARAEELPSESAGMQELADGRAREEEEAPDWVKELRVRTIRDYFADELKAGVLLTAAARNKLLADATRLHQYFEQDDERGELKSVPVERLEPFVRRLTPAELRPREQAVQEDRASYGDWTVEQLVINKDLASLAGRPHFFQRVKRLFGRPHLHGVSLVGMRLAVLAAGTYFLHHMHWDFAAGLYLLQGLNYAIWAGPGGRLTNALFEWFTTPTVDLIKVFQSRWFGKPSEWVNNAYDLIQPGSEKAGDNNHSPRLANLQIDKTNFAYMTTEDERWNWKKCLRMWVAVQTRFGKLLRDVHHYGRNLMMLGWRDEESAVQIVETLDTKLMAIEILSREAMGRAILIFRLDASGRDALERAFLNFEEVCSQVWTELNLSQGALKELGIKIRGAIEQLRGFGLSSMELDRLLTLQQQRALVVESIVTGLTVNEIRAFMAAESNRNLDEEARISQRVVRGGFHLQRYVEQYLPLIQEKQRQMGFRNSGAKPLEQDLCKRFLELVPLTP